MIEAAAVVVGGALPLLVLLGFSWWRVGQIARRSTATAERRKLQRTRKPRARRSLAWLRETFGPPPLEPGGLHRSSEATAVRCPHCRYLNDSPSVFCRRCGNRLSDV